MSAPRLQKSENGRWYVHWTEGRRSKRVSTGAESLDEAKAFLAQWLILDREAPAPDTATVADLWAAYDLRHVETLASPETARHSWSNLRVHFGGMLPATINQDSVDAYVAKRRAGKIGRVAKSGTVRRELAALRACLGWCVERNSLAAVPNFKLPADSAPRDRWLREAEVKRLLDAARSDGRMSRVERFLWLALYTAGRKTALLELTWDRVDFETGVIHLEAPDRTQTKKRRASVPIASSLRPILQRMHDERIGDLVLDNKAEIWSSVQIVAERAGLAPKLARAAGAKPRATGVSPHVLRHTAATHMARRGVPLYIVSKILGNTLAMVEKVYAKYAVDDLRNGVDTIAPTGGFNAAPQRERYIGFEVRQTDGG